MASSDIEDLKFQFQDPIIGGPLIHERGKNHEYARLSGSQLRAEFARCLNCSDAPCQKACPVGCSPKEFIYRAKQGKLTDLTRSVASIMSQNPFGNVCGLICPDKFCMKACSRAKIDHPINIPSIQHALCELAYEYNVFPMFSTAPCLYPNQPVAIIGGGVSGLSCAAFLGSRGYSVTIYEKYSMLGGACRYIPDHRLPPYILDTDIQFCLSSGNIHVMLDTIPTLEMLDKFSSVVISTGLPKVRSVGFKGEEYAINALDFLDNPKKYLEKCKPDHKVVVIGGGAVAVDCAVTAAKHQYSTSIMYRRGLHEMPINIFERNELALNNIDIISRTIPESYIPSNDILNTYRVSMPHRSTGQTNSVRVPQSESCYIDIDLIIIAAGLTHDELRRYDSLIPKENVFACGDFSTNYGTAVECAASGKTAANKVCQYLQKKYPTEQKEKISFQIAPISVSSPAFAPTRDYIDIPVDLSTSFFDIFTLKTPFILSAGPLTDGYHECCRSLDMGWSGVVMKTAFAELDIHVPSEYMDWMGSDTGFNADNISDHPIRRVEKEVPLLRQKYPDRLIMASTGGPVTGNDESDKKGWQSNTLRLEKCGSMAIEYSLSCPQGGDGTEGDIVSQNAQLSSKIIDWVMEISNPSIPKLFKLTPMVTSIQSILLKIKEVKDKYPNKLMGVTLANSFPTLVMRDLQDPKRKWEEGIIMGMSGKGILPVSLFSVAKASPISITISGNGGVFNYMDACHLMALGAGTVQVCTYPEKDGLEVFQDLCSGMSHLLEKRKIKSVKELINLAQPAFRDFMELTGVKKISSLVNDYSNICLKCGNCSRCPYNAITLDSKTNKGFPVIDSQKCVGCKFCVLTCPVQCLEMRKRTEKEIKKPYQY